MNKHDSALHNVLL